MKKLLLGAVVSLMVVGCSSASQQNSDGLTSQYTKYQIVDQEFDNLAIPNDSYDRVAPYEEQVNGASYIQSLSSKTKPTAKPGRQMKAQKTVVDGNGNALPADDAAPITDEEALPDEDL